MRQLQALFPRAFTLEEHKRVMEEGAHGRRYMTKEGMTKLRAASSKIGKNLRWRYDTFNEFRRFYYTFIDSFRR